MSLREAAQQALGTLERCAFRLSDPAFVAKAITALRAALAESKQEPLTDEQLEEAYKHIWRNLPDGFSHTLYEYIELGIRYAEKAHGIKEK